MSDVYVVEFDACDVHYIAGVFSTQSGAGMFVDYHERPLPAPRWWSSDEGVWEADDFTVTRKTVDP